MVVVSKASEALAIRAAMEIPAALEEVKVDMAKVVLNRVEMARLVKMVRMATMARFVIVLVAAAVVGVELVSPTDSLA
jgi:hypothetical protein